MLCVATWRVIHESCIGQFAAAATNLSPPPPPPLVEELSTSSLFKNMYERPSKKNPIRIPHKTCIPNDGLADGCPDLFETPFLSSSSSQSFPTNCNISNSPSPESGLEKGPLLLFCKFVRIDCWTDEILLATSAFKGPGAKIVSVNTA